MAEQLLDFTAGIVGAAGVDAYRSMSQNVHGPVELVHPDQNVLHSNQNAAGIGTIANYRLLGHPEQCWGRSTHKPTPCKFRHRDSAA